MKSTKKNNKFSQTLQEFTEKPFNNINMWLGTLNINDKQMFVIFIQQPTYINNLIRLPLNTTSTKEAMQILQKIRTTLETLTVTAITPTNNYRASQ